MTFRSHWHPLLIAGAFLLSRPALTAERGDLFASVLANDVGRVRTALQAGGHVDRRDSIGATPLMRALEHGASLELIKLLVKAGADVNAHHGGEEISVLMIAASYSTPHVMDFLLHAGARINQTGKGGWTALMSAARNTKDSGIIKTLVAGGADVHARDEYGCTALMRAAASNPNPEVVVALVMAGADVKARNNDGYSALDVARGTSNNPGVIAALQSLP